MAFEMVEGRFLGPDGSPLSGSVVFTPTFLFARDKEAVTLPAPVTAKLDAEGRVAASLLVPSPDTEPDAWVWEACPQLRGKHGVVKLRNFAFELTTGAPVNLAEVTPVPDPVSGDFVTKGDAGETGPAPELSIGEVVTVGPGEEAVSITGPAEAPVLDFALPRGALGWTGDKGDPGEPGPPGERGEKGEPGVSVASVTGAGDALMLGMTDGSSHRVPIPVGLIGQGAAGGVTDLGDGTGAATGTLSWEDRGDGTGVLAPAPGARLSFTATGFELPAGSTPTVEVSGVFPDFVLRVGVPTGAKGDRGEPGPAGPPGEPAPAPVVQDTGWRDISAFTRPQEGKTATGKLLLRRVDQQVFLYAHGYRWDATGVTQNFFDPALCAYTHPPQVPGIGQIRLGGSVHCADRNAVGLHYDWLSPDNIRIHAASMALSWGMTSWVTDTPFPAEPLGQVVNP